LELQLYIAVNSAVYDDGHFLAEDIPAPDMNTDARVMAWFFGACHGSVISVCCR